MSRAFSLNALEAIQARETDEAFLVLLTLSHPQMTTRRVVRNTVDVTSRGDVFTATAFDFVLPSEDATAEPRVTLQIDNVDRANVEVLRTINTPIDVALEVVLASDPDTVELGPIDMQLRGVQIDALRITGQVAGDPLLDAPYPADTYNQADYPGLA